MNKTELPSELRSKLSALTNSFLADLPKRFSEIERLWYSQGDPGWQGIHAQHLYRQLHSLAGSGMTFGIPDVGKKAGKLEQQIRAIINENRHASAEERHAMEHDLLDLERAVTEAIKNAAIDIDYGQAQRIPELPDQPLIYYFTEKENLTERFLSELAAAGYQLKCFTEADGFVDAFAESRPCAVIIDVDFPEEQRCGLSALRNIFQQADDSPPLIFISSRNDIHARLTALKYGAIRYFTKPVNFQNFVQTLDGLTERAPREPYRVLIVDDAEALANYYVTALEGAGFVAKVLTDPLLAIDELERFHPDLVLLDIYMPECSGLELAAVIRQDSQFAEMPIVFLSTENKPENMLASFGLEGDDFLTIPIDPGQLIKVILSRVKKARWLTRLRSDLQKALQDNERQKAGILRKEERLKRSQRYANTGIWDWEIKSGLWFWSEGAPPLFGQQAGEMETTYDAFLELLHPDDRHKVATALHASVKLNVDFEMEYRVMWPGGATHWLLMRGDVLRNESGEPLHMMGIIQDISRRKELETVLHEQKSMLSMLQNGLSQYLCSRQIDETGSYMLDGLLGLTQSEYGFIGEVLYDENNRPYLQTHVMSNLAWDKASADYFKSSSGAGLVIRNLDNVLGQVITSGDYVLINNGDSSRFGNGFPKGHPIPNCFLGVPVYFNEALVGVYGIANRRGGYDQQIIEFLKPFNASFGAIINAYRMAAQEQQIRHDLQKAKEQAVHASAAKSNFLNRMSHELRTPLNAILGFGQLLFTDSQYMSDEHKDFLNEILLAGRHLLELIDEVLDLAKIEAGKISLFLEPIDLVEVIAECHSLVKTQVEEHGLVLEINEPAEAIQVKADRLRLKQVLLNLLSNAVKYNRDNGQVRLTYQPVDGSQVRIDVEDSGPGIAADKVETLFDAFDRLGAEKTAIQGTGIGLMITKHFVELMHGRITVESTEGVGTTFSVTLPIVK